MPLCPVLPRAAAAPSILSRFAQRTEGLAAVEFALVLPLMVVFYFGLIGLTVGVMQDRKVTLLSRTVADLAGRTQTAMNDREINNIVGAGGSVLAPYDPNGINVVIASVAVRKTGTNAQGDIVEARICWSAARTITKVGDAYETAVAPVPADWGPNKLYPGTLPSGFATANSSFIMTLVDQGFKPPIGEEMLRFILGKDTNGGAGNPVITFKEKTPWPVRNVREVPWEGRPACLPAA